MTEKQADASQKEKFTTMTGLFSSKLFSKRKPVLSTNRSIKKRKIDNKEESERVEEFAASPIPRPTNTTITGDFSSNLDFPFDVTDEHCCSVEVKLSYIHQIHVNGALSLYGVLPNVAILRNFDEKTLKLSFNHHVIVKRRALNFSDGAHWVYSCSCKSSDVQFVASLNNDIFHTYEEFVEQKLINVCLHIDVVTDLISMSDALNNVSAEDGITECEHSYAAQNLEDCIIGNLPGPCVVIYYSQTKSYGVVMSLKQSLWCSVCGSNYCVHVQMIKKIQCTTDEISSEVNSVIEELGEIQRKRQWTPICHSKHTIPFKRDRKLAQKIENLDAKLTTSDILLPQETCTNCQYVKGEYSPAENCSIITSTCVYKKKVSTWTCQSCMCTMKYDGYADGLLNMGKYMVSHEMMRSYLHGFLHGKRTLAAFFHELKERHCDYGQLNFDSYFSYNKLKEAWYNYVHLLDIDYENGFCCNLCGPQPDTVVCDGTTLAFRQQMLKVDIPEKCHEELLAG